MFIEALFLIVKNWKQLNVHHQYVKGMDNFCYIRKMKHQSSIKSNEVLIHHNIEIV